DNNCNRLRDFADPACFPMNDTCSNPTLLPGAGTYSGGTRGTRPDYSFPCNMFGIAQDVVFLLAVPDVYDVHITMSGGGFTHALVLQTVCGDSSTDLRCDSDSDLYKRSVPAGNYYLIVGPDTETDFTLTVEFLPPTPPLANDTCASPTDI